MSSAVDLQLVGGEPSMQQSYVLVPAPAHRVELFSGEPDVLDVNAVARLLGVSELTVRREIGRGRLGCVHVGKCVRVTKQQLVDYVTERSN